MAIEFICEEISMLFHSEKFYGGGWWHCSYRVKLQVQVSQRFEIDPGPGPKLDKKTLLWASTDSMTYLYQFLSSLCAVLRNKSLLCMYMFDMFHRDEVSKVYEQKAQMY